MIYLYLFYTFFKVGLFTFGGGYAMISILQDEVISNNWLTKTEFTNFVGVSESTPGPIAVNMATFIGSSVGGLFGSFVATIGVILPSFIIILIIVSVLSNLLKYKGVGAFIDGIKPVVSALILGTGFVMFCNICIGLDKIGTKINFDYKNILIFIVLLLISNIYNKITKKKISIILLIITSLILGILLF